MSLLDITDPDVILLPENAEPPATIGGPGDPAATSQHSRKTWLRDPTRNPAAVLDDVAVVLITVPKAGSVSILRSAAALGGRTDVDPRSTPRDYLHIAVVRNTFDRVVSCWLQKTSREYARYISGLHNQDFYVGMSLEEFLHIVEQNPTANRHYCPQDIILGNPDDIDEVWFLHNLYQEWFAAFGTLPLHHNANFHRDRRWRPYYDETTLDMVYRIYHGEIKRWGFTP